MLKYLINLFYAIFPMFLPKSEEAKFLDRETEKLKEELKKLDKEYKNVKKSSTIDSDVDYFNKRRGK